MTQSEFEDWQEYYTQAPFDDFHRFHRPSALISTSFGGGKIEDRLQWLQPQPGNDEFSDADMATFKAFGLEPPKG